MKKMLNNLVLAPLVLMKTVKADVLDPYTSDKTLDSINEYTSVGFYGLISLAGTVLANLRIHKVAKQEQPFNELVRSNVLPTALSVIPAIATGLELVLTEQVDPDLAAMIGLLVYVATSLHKDGRILGRAISTIRGNSTSQASVPLLTNAEQKGSLNSDAEQGVVEVKANVSKEKACTAIIFVGWTLTAAGAACYNFLYDKTTLTTAAVATGGKIFQDVILFAVGSRKASGQAAASDSKANENSSLFGNSSGGYGATR